MTSYIYVIENKVNGMAYVGKANDVKRRWGQHLRAAKRGVKLYLYCAMRKYGIENFLIRVVDSSDDDVYTLNVLEPLWISRLREEGLRLYNLNSGGGGCYRRVFTQDHLKKLSLAAMGHKRNVGNQRSEETKMKISKSRTGIVFSEETKIKMRESARKRIHKKLGPMSDEVKKKISESLRKRFLTEETKKKISESKLGKKHSDETKSKMSESQKGKVISEECRQKIRESLLGRSPTDETRKKISEANKGVPKPPRSQEHCKKLSDVAKERGSMSEEHKQKISESLRTSDKVGHPVDEETRAKISEKLRGRTHSEETRAKRAESLRKFYERKRLAKLDELHSQSSSPPEVATTEKPFAPRESHVVAPEPPNRFFVIENLR
jgi:group I intron endonuclease